MKLYSDGATDLLLDEDSKNISVKNCSDGRIRKTDLSPTMLKEMQIGVQITHNGVTVERKSEDEFVAKYYPDNDSRVCVFIFFTWDLNTG